MTNDSLILNGSGYCPSVFKFRSLLGDLSSIVHKANEVITCVASYQANIYVGTSLGQILHYHRFEDASEYMIISQLQISQDKKPIKRILVLPQIERALILCGGIASVYNVPELSPSHIGKLKNIVDLLYLAAQEANSEIQPTVIHEQVLILTNEKLRVIRVSQELIKLIKDISYSNAIKCEAFKYLDSPNSDFLAVVANEKNYDIIDLNQIRKVPLFDYNSDNASNVSPQVIPFFPNNDESNEELLLTVKSDETTSMSMFINSSGDITRGTLLWPKEEYPSHGLSIIWPYVFAICEGSTKNSRMVVSSLESLEVHTTSNLEILLGISDNQKEQIKNNETNDKPDSQSCDESSPQELEDTEVNATTTPEQKIERQDIEMPYDFKIIQLHKSIHLHDEVLSGLLNKTDLSNNSITPSSSKYSLVSSTLIYKGYDMWLMYEQHKITTLTKKLQESTGLSSLKKEDIQDITNLIEGIAQQSTGELEVYSFHLLSLIFLLQDEFDKCMKIALQSADNISSPLNLIVDPRFMIFAVDDFQPEISILSGFQTFTSLLTLSKSLVRGTDSQKEFLTNYFEKLYTEILKDINDDNREIVIYIRMRLYRERFTSSRQLVSFISEHDKEIWTGKDLNHCDLIALMKARNNYFGLLHIYLILIEHSSERRKTEISKDICELSLELLRNEVIDPDINELVNSDIHINGTVFNLLKIVLSQLKDNLSLEKVYSVYLIEVLKLNPSEGIAFMKANNANLKETHKHIMEEMSDSFSNEVSLSQLRLEYMESNFLETLQETIDLETLDEFLIELSNEIVSKLDDSNMLNFDAIEKTFQVENTLDDSKWPKISWPAYLRIVVKQSQCQQFIHLYLKILELLVFRTRNHNGQYIETINKFETIMSNNSIFDYYKLIYDEKKDHVLGLLEFSDYSSAEYVALYGTFPLPTELYYFKNVNYAHQTLHSSIKDRLSIVLEFYINENKDSNHFLAIKHFISTYGDFFTFREILDMLPQQFPIVYFQDYLKSVLINLDTDHRDIALKKVLSKNDSKFTKELCEDLATGYEN